LGLERFVLGIGRLELAMIVYDGMAREDWVLTAICGKFESRGCAYIDVN
jgi:hypothetical protein